MVNLSSLSDCAKVCYSILHSNKPVTIAYLPETGIPVIAVRMANSVKSTLTLQNFSMDEGIEKAWELIHKYGGKYNKKGDKTCGFMFDPISDNLIREGFFKE
jgi:hypothetical protein